MKLGMEKARARGKAVGRPVVVDKVDTELVVRLREPGQELAGDRRRPSDGEVQQWKKGEAQCGITQEGV